MTGDVKEYHKRPVLSVRVDADLKAFAVAEAKRPGMTLGDVVGEALADLRAKRTADHVTVPVPVAARQEQPKAKGKRANAPREPEGATTIAAYYRDRNGGDRS